MAIHDNNEEVLHKPKRFSYWQVKRMVGGFDARYIIGYTGFGVVYSGNFGETKVAVKVFRKGNATQFKNEVEAYKRVNKHENIVNLIGYCEGWRRLYLVYEFMNGGDLKTLLSGEENNLSWTERLSIAIGAAKGLEYLHDKKPFYIIHGDVKPSNIMLSKTVINGKWGLQAKIADFSVCRIRPEECSTTFTTRIAGTLRYIDPEYLLQNKLSKKVDAYSFGVTLLELIYGLNRGGYREADELIHWAMQKICNDDICSELDTTVKQATTMNSIIYKDSVNRVAKLAVSCVMLERELKRPRPTMREIVEELIECSIAAELMEFIAVDLSRFKTPTQMEIKGNWGSPSSTVYGSPTNSEFFYELHDYVDEKMTTKHGDEEVVRETKRFSYWDMILMTWGFMKKPIGQGSFGIIYSGKFGETRVAIKVLKKENTATTEFQNEMKVCKNISHDNVVSLIGYCNDKRKLCLVYEFMDGQDLRTVLKDKKNELSWMERLSIAIEAAQGLEYLHYGFKGMCIIHRDVKSSNILLGTKQIAGGQRLQAKIADFGTCRIYPEETIKTIYSEDLAGTLRYIAPEYLRANMLTKKIDVYSFGVVLLELIYGINPKGCQAAALVYWATQRVRSGNIASELDSRVEQDITIYKEAVIRAVKLAVACVNLDRTARPTMKQVVAELIECKNLGTVNSMSSRNMHSPSMELGFENEAESSRVATIARSFSMGSSHMESPTSSAYLSAANSEIF